MGLQAAGLSLCLATAALLLVLSLQSSSLCWTIGRPGTSLLLQAESTSTRRGCLNDVLGFVCVVYPSIRLMFIMYISVLCCCFVYCLSAVLPEVSFSFSRLKGEFFLVQFVMLNRQAVKLLEVFFFIITVLVKLGIYIVKVHNIQSVKFHEFKISLRKKTDMCRYLSLSLVIFPCEH